MKSTAQSWINCSNVLFNTIDFNNIEPLYDAFDAAQRAVNTVTSAGDIGSLNLPVTRQGIESLNEKRRKLVSFCNAIHYEISELIDNPFSVRTAGILEASYDLDPKDFKVKTGKTLWWNKMTSLGDLMISTMTDEDLKSDFAKRVKALDEDKVSDTLKEAIKEARFWRGEFEKSNRCQEIATDVFTSKIRGQWSSITEARRKEIVEDYADRIGNELFGRGMIIKYDSTGEGSYGYADDGTMGIGRHISINPRFVTNPKKDYSIDNLIDTLTHESRHQYQDKARSSLFNSYDLPDSLKGQWKAPYITYAPEKDNYFQYYNQEVERDARAFAGVSRPD